MHHWISFALYNSHLLTPGTNLLSLPIFQQNIFIFFLLLFVFFFWIFFVNENRKKAQTTNTKTKTVFSFSSHVFLPPQWKFMNTKLFFFFFTRFNEFLFISKKMMTQNFFYFNLKKWKAKGVEVLSHNVRTVLHIFHCMYKWKHMRLEVFIILLCCFFGDKEMQLLVFFFLLK